MLLHPTGISGLFWSLLFGLSSDILLKVHLHPPPRRCRPEASAHCGIHQPEQLQGSGQHRMCYPEPRNFLLRFSVTALHRKAFRSAMALRCNTSTTPATTGPVPNGIPSIIHAQILLTAGAWGTLLPICRSTLQRSNRCLPTSATGTAYLGISDATIHHAQRIIGTFSSSSGKNFCPVRGRGAGEMCGLRMDAR